MSKCKHFAHQYTAFAFIGNVQACFITRSQQTSAIVETYACGNSLHAIHASARTLHTYLYAYPEMAYLTGIEMTAPYLAPVYHRTNSYTCTHIEIYEVLRYLPEPPKTFGTGGTLYIIVYMTRYTVNFFKSPKHVRLALVAETKHGQHRASGQDDQQEDIYYIWYSIHRHQSVKHRGKEENGNPSLSGCNITDKSKKSSRKAIRIGLISITFARNKPIYP